MRRLLEGLLDLRDARVLLHHQEIRFAILVEFADATEEESGASVFVADHGDELPAAGHREHRDRERGGKKRGKRSK